MERREKNDLRGRNLYNANVVTVFVDGIPWRGGYDWLWDVYGRIGRVLDVFIPRKTISNSTKRYGFVRYGSLLEAKNAVAETNGYLFYGFKAFANLARFGLKYRMQNSSAPTQSNLPQKQYPQISNRQPEYGIPKNEWRQKFSVGSKTFADVLKTDPIKPYGDNPQGAPSPDRDRYEDITIEAKEFDTKWLDRSLMAELISIGDVPNLQSNLNRHGVIDVIPRLMGGKFILLEFITSLAKSQFMKNENHFLKKGIKNFREWESRWFSHERITWVNFDGVPLHAWNVSTFTQLGEFFGDVISLDELTSSRKIINRGRVLISTSCATAINKMIVLKVAGEIFPITAKEETGCTFSWASDYGEQSITTEANSSYKRESNNNPNIIPDDANSADEGIQNSNLRKVTDDVDVANDVDSSGGCEVAFHNTKEQHRENCLEPDVNPMLAESSPEVVETGIEIADSSGIALPLTLQEECEAHGQPLLHSLSDLGPNAITIPGSNPINDDPNNSSGLHTSEQILEQGGADPGSNNSENNELFGLENPTSERQNGGPSVQILEQGGANLGSNISEDNELIGLEEGCISQKERKKTKFSGINTLIYGNKRRIYEELLAKKRKGKAKKNKGSRKDLMKKGMKECFSNYYCSNEEDSCDDSLNGEAVSDAAFNNGNRLFNERVEATWNLGKSLGIECPGGKDDTYAQIAQFFEFNKGAGL